MQMGVGGRSVQNSPLDCLISEVSESHQHLHNPPGCQKHLTHMICHACFPLPTTFLTLKVKGNPVQIPGQGAGDVPIQSHFESTESIPAFTNMADAYSSFNFTER